MNKQTQLNVRLDDDDAKAVAALRHFHTKGAKIPSASDIMRQALARMYREDMKVSGRRK